MHHRSGRSGASLALGLLMLTGGVLGAAAFLRKSRHWHRDENAPAQSLHEQGAGSQRLVGRTVTIAKPRNEIYTAWREFSQFPVFMENVISVEPLDERRSKWAVGGPAGTIIEFTSAITEDEPGEAIAWSSEDDAAVPNSGRVTFRDAPGGRGTVVDLDIVYDPPGGAIGALVAKAFQREPNIQARRDLKRFKQLMETGEVATSRTRPQDRPS